MMEQDDIWVRLYNFCDSSHNGHVRVLFRTYGLLDLIVLIATESQDCPNQGRQGRNMGQSFGPSTAQGRVLQIRLDIPLPRI
jgi:hypothetical protein